MTTQPPMSSPLLGQFATYPFSIARGAGDQVVDEQGQAYWDFYGGHCVASTGHCHPTVVNAIKRQLDKLLFYSTAAHLPIRDAAAQALLDAAPAGMGGVFFCNSGAEANENALKLAIQLTGRKQIVAFDGAFHGRTLLALAATDNPKLNAPFAGIMPSIQRLAFADPRALEEADFSDAAAVIVEPVQSMAGVRTAPPDWFARLAAKAADAGAFLIFDEVQTGAGRLGAAFAAELFEVQPDIITCAKGIASGMPIGALIAQAGLAQEIPASALGSTFGGSPLASAALLATLQVIRDEELCTRAKIAEVALRNGLVESVVSQVRGRGLLLGLDAGEQARKLRQYLLAQHILVGGSADPHVLRLMPPLIISQAGIQALVEAVHAFAPVDCAV